MDVLLIVDMQTGVLEGDAKHDLSAVVGRIRHLAHRVRRGGGKVVLVQHDGHSGDLFAPGARGWPILSELAPEAGDLVIHKTLNSAFIGTSLETDLSNLRPDRVLVVGWATDMCVDATVRSAAERGFPVVVVADCHTVADRPHLEAEAVRAHHHWIWANLYAEHRVRIASASEL